MRNEREGTNQLFDDGLDEGSKGEPLRRLRVPDVLAQHGDGLGVGLGLKVVASLLENHLELLVVCDDSVVDDGELLVVVALVRVAVKRGGLSVRGPSGVSHRGLGEERLGHVDRRAGDEFSQLGDLADLLEEPVQRGANREEKWREGM
jgi:hypothetical protein